MSDDKPILELPALQSNPFTTRPLEKGQSSLLIGRGDIAARWARFLKQRNARMILLVGESGTGRTSLLRCVGEETSTHIHLEMFPSSDQQNQILHEIYGSMIGFDIPGSTQELVSRLAKYTQESDGPLPLISLDYTNGDGTLLGSVISSLMAGFQRLDAVVVITLTTDQRAQWSESLINRFDHVEVLKNLDDTQIKDLCEKRISTVASSGWSMNESCVEFLADRSIGQPSKLMRLMRDMVDDERSRPRKPVYDEPEPIIESASTQMWTKEPELAQPQASVGFDLDMDILDQPPPQPRMQSFAGPFGGLRSRNKDQLNYTPSEDYILDEEKLPREIWVDPSSELMMEAQIVEEEVFEPESQPEVEIENEVPILEQLVAALNLPEGMGLAELLSAMRRPVIGTKQSNPLDLMTLRNLSHNDATLVEVASQRSFSPSDARLQDSLGVKRPRMSQMCNRLYRAGILTVQQKGRSRYFVLTNDAKAQLIAWGMMEDSQ
jgi:hypothetical protein